MEPFVRIVKKFWANTEKEDLKRLATQSKPEGICEINDIPYIDDGNKYHLMDLYYPEGTTGKLPVIIDVHGGGWVYGDKELNKYFCMHMAKRGFAVFNMSYRLYNDVTVNEQLQDIGFALRWISEHAQEYPCDMENIMLVGDSAGGQLAAYSAVLMSSPELRHVFGIAEYEMKLTALTLISPVAYMDDGIMGVYCRRMWGDNYKRKDTHMFMNLDSILPMGKLPPTMLITSSGDFLARSQTHRAAEDLRRNGVTAKLLDYSEVNGKKLDHVFSVIYPESASGADAIDNFCNFFKKFISSKTAINKGM
ncbi:MAG: alpha/beta hydrolase [Clostridia bacterium]|nr:alpha/beta hydrolase [Clostridia bacterium]